MTPKARNTYLKLRAALITRGYTIAKWAHEKGYQASTVYDAAKGRRNGVTSTKIRRELQEEANA